jgi:hypothetical protein
MNEDLQKLITEARRELRRASGISLSPEENEEERRKAEIEEFDRFAYRTFGYRLMLPLKFHVVWNEKGAIGQMSVNGHIFNLRKHGENYHLLLIGEHGERELSQLEGSDPNFANRVLVAIGDILPTLKNGELRVGKFG